MEMFSLKLKWTFFVVRETELEICFIAWEKESTLGAIWKQMKFKKKIVKRKGAWFYIK